MGEPEFKRYLSALCARVEELQERAGNTPVRDDEVLSAAFQELQNSLEELRVAEEELRQQNEEMITACEIARAEQRRYQELFDFAPDGNVVTDPHGIILEANQAIADRLQVRPGTLIGKPLTLFMRKEDRSEFRSFLTRLSHGEAVRPGELYLLPRRGAPFPTSLRMAPARNGGGPLKSVRWVFHDLTELKEVQRRALQAERMAAVGQMMAVLAHESRNALQRSQASLDLLALEVQDRPKALDLLAKLEKAQDDLRHLFEEVQEFAAPIRVQRRTCNLAEIWREAWANLAPLHQGRDAKLCEESGGIDLSCRGDPFRLGQVFRNILENALAACTDPVRIEIVCSEVNEAGGQAIQVAIRDNGPGLGAEQRQRIFEPFYTTKTRGMGLGMAIASRIMDAHGGRIAVGEREGRGTEIRITLPRDKP